MVGGGEDEEEDEEDEDGGVEDEDEPGADEDEDDEDDSALMPDDLFPSASIDARFSAVLLDSAEFSPTLLPDACDPSFLPISSANSDRSPALLAA